MIGASRSIDPVPWAEMRSGLTLDNTTFVRPRPAPGGARAAIAPLAGSAAVHALVVGLVVLAAQRTPDLSTSPQPVAVMVEAAPAPSARTAQPVSTAPPPPQAIPSALPGQAWPVPPVPPPVVATLTPEPAPQMPTSGAKHLASPRPRPPPPRPPAAPPPAAAAPPQAGAAALAPPASPDWTSALETWLQAHKVYPAAARRRGEEGTAQVRFTVDRQGHIGDVALLHGTGFGDLDDAVRRMLRDASVPAFPASMTQAQTAVTVRIRYLLEP
jgi:protein TonB